MRRLVQLLALLGGLQMGMVLLLAAAQPALGSSSHVQGRHLQQSNEYIDWLDNHYPSPEYRAATVVTNLWLAGFSCVSCLFGLLGAVVAVQWPNPRILCYKTSYSDRPSSSRRSCCSLYSLNLGFCVFWLLVFAVVVIARDVVRIIVCLCFSLVHVCVVIVFRMKFKRFGRPEAPYAPGDPLVASSSASTGRLGPRPVLGVPIYNIPLQTVVIGAPDANGVQQHGGAGGAAGTYWGVAYPDAACVPPPQQVPPQPPGAQQPGQHGGVYPGAGAAAAAAAGPFAVPLPTGSYPSYAYPPQPAAAATSTTTTAVSAAAPYPAAAAAAPVVGLPAAGEPAAAAAAASAAPGVPLMFGPAVPAVAGVPAAAGAAAGPTGPQQQQQQLL